MREKEEPGMGFYELYDFAVDQRIDVDWYTMPSVKSLSIFIPSLGQRATILDSQKLETVADEFTTLGHEVGHCVTYSFYSRWAVCDVKKKHESRADKWGIRQFPPLGALEAAAHEGCTEVWDLAERFGVIEDLVRKAICWYKHGSLVVDQYL